MLKLKLKKDDSANSGYNLTEHSANIRIKYRTESQEKQDKSTHEQAAAPQHKEEKQNHKREKKHRRRKN